MITNKDQLNFNNTNAFILHYHNYCHNTSIHRHAVTAGLYNTGTNALYKLLENNCDYSKYRLFWQPQWGKHEIVTKQKILEWDIKNNNKSWNQFSINFNCSNALMIVIIKDPLTWIKSICKASYGIKFINDIDKRRNFKKTCPKNVSISKLKWIYKIDRIFDDIISVWNIYYQNWLNEIDADIYPMVMVRFEDLLFRPYDVANRLCGCIGHNRLLNGTVTLSDGKAKAHGKSNNRSEAMRIYGDKEYRYDGYTKNDLLYIDEHVNHTLLQIFGYGFDKYYFA